MRPFSPSHSPATDETRKTEQKIDSLIALDRHCGRQRQNSWYARVGMMYFVVRIYASWKLGEHTLPLFVVENKWDEYGLGWWWRRILWSLAEKCRIWLIRTEWTLYDCTSTISDESASNRMRISCIRCKSDTNTLMLAVGVEWMTETTSDNRIRWHWHAWILISSPSLRPPSVPGRRMKFVEFLIEFVWTRFQRDDDRWWWWRRQRWWLDVICCVDWNDFVSSDNIRDLIVLKFMKLRKQQYFDFIYKIRRVASHTRFCVVLNTIQWRAIVSPSRDIFSSGNFDQRSTKWNLYPHALSLSVSRQSSFMFSAVLFFRQMRAITISKNKIKRVFRFYF